MADIWCNPPPPGTEVEDRGGAEHDRSPKSRGLDEIDPYLKNPHYIEYEKHHRSRSKRSRSRERRHSRSRSRNRHRHKKEKRRRSRSRSYKRSRSRGRHHRHRSKSRSESRHRHHKERKRKRSASSSSRSSSRSRSPNHRTRRSRRSRSRRSIEQCDIKPERNPENDEDEEEETEPPKENVFKNDGSFLEMFKKMQEEQQKAQADKQEAGTSDTKKSLPFFGKRRGGRVLKTGMVQKTKAMQDNELENAQDAWSIYMKEVKKYKEACCDDDTKTRPLVK